MTISNIDNVDFVNVGEPFQLLVEPTTVEHVKLAPIFVHLEWQD